MKATLHALHVVAQMRRSIAAEMLRWHVLGIISIAIPIVIFFSESFYTLRRTGTIVNLIACLTPKFFESLRRPNIYR